MHDEAAGQSPSGVDITDEAEDGAGAQRHRDGHIDEAVVLGQRRDDAGGWLLVEAVDLRHPRHSPDAEHELEEVVVVRPALPKAGVAGAGASHRRRELEGSLPPGAHDGLRLRGDGGGEARQRDPVAPVPGASRSPARPVLQDP